MKRDSLNFSPFPVVWNHYVQDSERNALHFAIENCFFDLQVNSGLSCNLIQRSIVILLFFGTSHDGEVIQSLQRKLPCENVLVRDNRKLCSILLAQFLYAS